MKKPEIKSKDFKNPPPVCSQKILKMKFMQNVGTTTNKNMNIVSSKVSDNNSSSKRKDSNISMSNSSVKSGIIMCSSSSSAESESENQNIDTSKFIKF